MPALCSKTLTLLIWDDDNTGVGQITINHDPWFASGGGTLYSSGLTIGPGIFKLEFDSSFGTNPFTYNGTFGGTPLALATTGDGVCIPNVELVPGGLINGASSQDAVAATAQANCRANTAGLNVLLTFKLLASTLLQWRWGPIFGNMCSCVGCAPIGGGGHRYNVTRIGKVCGT